MQASYRQKYKFSSLPEAVCCLQTCNGRFVMTLIWCSSVLAEMLAQECYNKFSA